MENNERIGGFFEMINLNVKGVDIVIKGLENLPYVYRDMLKGKFIGKPIVQVADRVIDEWFRIYLGKNKEILG